MAIQISMSGPGADTELTSLYAWLRDEPDIRRHSQMSLQGAEPGPAEMGTALDIIQLVVDSGFQAANLALAYAAWRATRPKPPKVTLEHNGVTVTLDGSESDNFEVIVQTCSISLTLLRVRKAPRPHNDKEFAIDSVQVEERSPVINSVLNNAQ